MQARSSLGNALVTALLSILLMIGALSISLVEFVPEVTPTATNIVLPSPIPLTATSTLEPSATPLVFETPTVGIPTSTNTVAPSNCPTPPGWGWITVQYSDTLDGIAIKYRVDKNKLMLANCLLTENLVMGATLYVPPVATNTPAICNQGAAGWAHSYVVKAGDTIFAIASSYGTSAATLRYVNCRMSDLIYAGETLWVPNVATRTPTVTPLPGTTATPFPTDIIIETVLPFTVTPIPSETPVPPTPIPTNTFEPTATLTAFP